jgi:NAD(P)-dependent dehydrogenase (short-subunit alcohol dehydrogenase family)
MQGASGIAYFRPMAWTAARLPDLNGRTAIVTGANSGIGWQTAKELAVHGARVVLACRDIEHGKKALERIRSACADADVEVAPLDLARIASVREFAEQATEPLDLLVNNAGVMAPPKPVTTADGFELQFGTNHLGHFVLTGLLLGSLLRTNHPRVVTVSSVAHFGGTAEVVEGNAGGPYDPQKSYSNSKLANLLFSEELQRRAAEHGTALMSAAAHPGIASTGLVVDRQGMGANPFLRVVGPVFLKIFTQSAAAGARPSLFAAVEGGPGSYTGPQRFGQSRGVIGPARKSACARDGGLARQLWAVSEDLTGFRYPWPD